MRTIKFSMHLNTGFVGGKHEEDAEIQVPDDESEEDIEAEVEAFTANWKDNLVEWGYWIHKDETKDV